VLRLAQRAAEQCSCESFQFASAFASLTMPVLLAADQLILKRGTLHHSVPDLEKDCKILAAKHFQHYPQLVYQVATYERRDGVPYFDGEPLCPAWSSMLWKFGLPFAKWRISENSEHLPPPETLPHVFEVLAVVKTARKAPTPNGHPPNSHDAVTLPARKAPRLLADPPNTDGDPPNSHDAVTLPARKAPRLLADPPNTDGDPPNSHDAVTLPARKAPRLLADPPNTDGDPPNTDGAVTQPAREGHKLTEDAANTQGVPKPVLADDM
jgi:hypothetical protein